MDMKSIWTRPATLTVAALLLLAALSGCNLFGPPAIYDTADISVFVDSGPSGSFAPTANLAPGGPSLVIAGTTSPSEITQITLTVVGDDKFGVFQDPLATVPDLPLGPPLTFSLQAFDGSGTLIYTATTTTVLSAGNLSVALVLTPYDDGATQIFFPVIRQITQPAEIIHGTDAQVAIALEGSSTETLTVDLTSGGGLFAPASPIAVPLSSGAANLDLTYSAPADSPATYLHTVRAENEQGNSVSRDFTTVVVWETADGDVTIGGIAPAVTGLALSLNRTDLVLEATVTDDGPSGDLSYEWSFDAGLSFTDATANPAALAGYSEAATGTVTLTVTDSDTSIQAGGLSTTVSFVLPAGLFPDVVGADPPSGPPVGQLLKLTASDAAAFDYFGFSVSISGDTAIVGAFADDDAGSQSGSAYIFGWDGSQWTQTTKLTASDAALEDQFGASVSVSGDTALVGAYSDDDAGGASGSAYTFGWDGSQWSETAKLTASDAAPADRFGISVSISGNAAIVGAALNDDAGSYSGSAYVIRVMP